MVLQYTVLRKVFGTEEEEVTWDWTRLSNEKFHDFHSLPTHPTSDEFEKVVMDGHVAVLG